MSLSTLLVDVGAPVQQKARHAPIAKAGGIGEKGMRVVTLAIDVDATVEKQSHYFLLVCSDRQSNHRQISLVLCMAVSTRRNGFSSDSYLMVFDGPDKS